MKAAARIWIRRIKLRRDVESTLALARSMARIIPVVAIAGKRNKKKVSRTWMESAPRCHKSYQAKKPNNAITSDWDRLKMVNRRHASCAAGRKTKTHPRTIQMGMVTGALSMAVHPAKGRRTETKTNMLVKNANSDFISLGSFACCVEVACPGTAQRGLPITS